VGLPHKRKGRTTPPTPSADISAQTGKSFRRRRRTGAPIRSPGPFQFSTLGVIYRPLRGKRPTAELEQGRSRPGPLGATSVLQTPVHASAWRALEHTLVETAIPAEQLVRKERQVIIGREPTNAQNGGHAEELPSEPRESPVPFSERPETAAGTPGPAETEIRVSALLVAEVVRGLVIKVLCRWSR
jgi:hypothetical protein